MGELRCGCVLEAGGDWRTDGPDESWVRITYCPMHNAAPAMLAALERIKAETTGAAEGSTPSRVLVETLHHIAANVVDQARGEPAHA